MSLTFEYEAHKGEDGHIQKDAYTKRDTNTHTHTQRESKQIMIDSRWATQPL